MTDTLSSGDDALPFTVEDPPEGSLNSFSIRQLTSSEGKLLVELNGIAGNLPQKNQNTLALWDTVSPNPSSDTPLKVFPITGNNQPSRQYIDYPFLTVNYGLTYQVGPKPNTMCGLTILRYAPPTLTAAYGFPTDIQLKLRSVTKTSLQIQYSVLSGYLPHTFGNWIGLWNGFASPYSGGEPVGRVAIPNDDNMAILNMDNLSLYTQFQYTLIYFMKEQTSRHYRQRAGAILYFSTQG